MCIRDRLTMRTFHTGGSVKTVVTNVPQEEKVTLKIRGRAEVFKIVQGEDKETTEMYCLISNKDTQSAHKKYKVIIAGAGGAAHLPGMISSLTNLPVIGVPIETKSLKGLDSLLSVVQMPKGIVTATVAINNAMNAGLLAAQIVALLNNEIKKNLERFRVKQTKSIKIKPKK